MDTSVGGICDKSVQKCPKDWGLVFLIVNCIFPGFGTMFSSYCGKTINWEALLVGFLQFLLLFICVGWIWSIVWGVRIYDKSK